MALPQEVFLPSSAVVAGAAEDCGVERDAVANSKGGDTLTHGIHRARGLMLHHQRRNAAARFAGSSLNIAAARYRRRPRESAPRRALAEEC